MARVSRGSSSKRRTERKRAKQNSHSQTRNSIWLYTHGAMQNVCVCFFFFMLKYILDRFLILLFLLHLYNKECKGQSFKINVLNRPLYKLKHQSYFIFHLSEFIHTGNIQSLLFFSLSSKYIFKGSCACKYIQNSQRTESGNLRKKEKSLLLAYFLGKRPVLK